MSCNTSKCFGFLCDLFCVCFALCSSYLAVLSIMSNFRVDKPNPDASGSGFHLLSCPNLFTDVYDGVDDGSSHADIRLSADSTARLMATLKSSLPKAHLLHAGGAHKASPIASAIEDQLGANNVVDVNIPRKTDNTHICQVLGQIVNEQNEKEREHSILAEPGPHVTISILKLQPKSGTKERDSILLRGAKKLESVSSGPVMTQIAFKLTSLDEKIRKVLDSFKVTDVDVNDAIKIA